jgi:hypothetical protein
VILFTSLLLWPPILSVFLSLALLLGLLFLFGDISRADLAALRQVFSVRQ